ncbi:MAG: flagellar biosynthetic protein FliO [Candidatus Eisenbacteria bacterium]
MLQRVARRCSAGFARGGSDRIEIVSQRAIAPRVSLAVVRVMGRTLLVGISPHGVSAVSALDETPSAPLPRLEETASLSPESAPQPMPQLAPQPSPQLPPRPEPKPIRAASIVRDLERREEPGLQAPTLGFEDELRTRLRSLKTRYPSLREVETGAMEGVH